MGEICHDKQSHAAPVLSVERISKKFCRDLRRSLSYGVRDIAREFVGLRSTEQKLRPGEFWALSEVTFRLGRGEAVAAIGANGAGKTTLLRILAGILRPDSGRAVVRGRVVPLIALGAGFKPILTGRENACMNLAILGLNRRELARCLNEVIEFAELRDVIDAPLKTYSTGMAARLGFACAVHTKPDLLLIDEVLAVGDARFRIKCYQRLAELRRHGTSFMLVSHSPNAVLSTCESALYLSGGKLVMYADAPTVMQRYESDLFSLHTSQSSNGMDTVVGVEQPDGNFRLVGLEFRDQFEQPSGGLVSGRPGSLRIGYAAREKIPNVSILVLVRELFSDGAQVLSLSTGTRGVDLEGGEGQIVLDLPFCGLGPGHYTMKIGVTCGPLQHLAAVESLRFHVNPSEHVSQQGLFYQPCSWRVITGVPKSSGPQAE